MKYSLSPPCLCRLSVKTTPASYNEWGWWFMGSRKMKRGKWSSADVKNFEFFWEKRVSGGRNCKQRQKCRRV